MVHAPTFGVSRLHASFRTGGGRLRRIGVEERRARLALRHRLVPSAKASDAVEAARAVVGLHATDPASVFLSAWARMRAADVTTIETELYDARRLVRMLGMRRTMFVLPADTAAVVQAACTRAVAVRLRRRLERFIDQSGFAEDPAGWLTELEEATLHALEERGEAAGAELSRAVPGLREQVMVGLGTKWEGRQGLTTLVLSLLGADGRIVRGRPRGSWTSSQYRWVAMQDWLPDGLAHWSTEAAQVELARRWLAAFGPATIADLKWWTGWSAGEVKRALTAVRPVEVDLDGEPGLVLADDVAPPELPAPWVALLPALDSTVMGWTGRAWYLGEHAPVLFDRSGNAGPTVWWHGRIVGGWGQRRDGEVAIRLLEDVGADARGAIETESDRLNVFLGGTRVTPRFWTPLQKELAV